MSTAEGSAGPPDSPRAPDGPRPPDPPRGEAPAWVPLAGLGGLLLMLLFTTWYMSTEPAHRWPDAIVHDAATDGGPAATDTARPATDTRAADAAVDAAADGGLADGAGQRD